MNFVGGSRRQIENNAINIGGQNVRVFSLKQIVDAIKNDNFERHCKKWQF